MFRGTRSPTPEKGGNADARPTPPIVDMVQRCRTHEFATLRPHWGGSTLNRLSTVRQKRSSSSGTDYRACARTRPRKGRPWRPGMQYPATHPKAPITWDPLPSTGTKRAGRGTVPSEHTSKATKSVVKTTGSPSTRPSAPYARACQWQTPLHRPRYPRRSLPLIRQVAADRAWGATSSTPCTATPVSGPTVYGTPSRTRWACRQSPLPPPPPPQARTVGRVRADAGHPNSIDSKLLTRPETLWASSPRSSH